MFVIILTLLGILIFTICFLLLAYLATCFLLDRLSLKLKLALNDNNISLIALIIVMIIGLLLFGLCADYFGPNSYEEQQKQKQRIQQCYKEGIEAARYDLPCESCPYGPLKSKYAISRSQEMEAWMKGWTQESIKNRLNRKRNE